MCFIGHKDHSCCAVCYRGSDLQLAVKKLMAAVGKHNLSGLAAKGNIPKSSFLFQHKYHEVFVSEIVQHDNEHSYHFWYGRLPCF